MKKVISNYLPPATIHYERGFKWIRRSLQQSWRKNKQEYWRERKERKKNNTVRLFYRLSLIRIHIQIYTFDLVYNKVHMLDELGQHTGLRRPTASSSIEAFRGVTSSPVQGIFRMSVVPVYGQSDIHSHWYSLSLWSTANCNSSVSHLL